MRWSKYFEDLKRIFLEAWIPTRSLRLDFAYFFFIGFLLRKAKILKEKSSNMFSNI